MGGEIFYPYFPLFQIVLGEQRPNRRAIALSGLGPGFKLALAF